MIPFALFDTDSMELNETGRGLGFRPRAEVLAPKLERLHTIARQRGLPLWFTTCCSGRMLKPDDCKGDLADILFLPLQGDTPAWKDDLVTARRVYVAKATTGNPKQNAACRMFDMFAHNGNLAQAVPMMKVHTWVVFGNGFDYCVGSAVRGLLGLGQRVVLLTDVKVSSAGGTTDSEQETIRQVTGQGATLSTLDAIVKDLSELPPAAMGPA